MEEIEKNFLLKILNNMVFDAGLITEEMKDKIQLEMKDKIQLEINNL